MFLVLLEDTSTVVATATGVLWVEVFLEGSKIYLYGYLKYCYFQFSSPFIVVRLGWLLANHLLSVLGSCFAILIIFVISYSRHSMHLSGDSGPVHCHQGIYIAIVGIPVGNSILRSLVSKILGILGVGILSGNILERPKSKKYPIYILISWTPKSLEIGTQTF